MVSTASLLFPDRPGEATSGCGNEVIILTHQDYAALNNASKKDDALVPYSSM